MQQNTQQTLNDLKIDFERLREQMTPEVQAFNSLLFKLFEVLILSLPNKKATSNNSHLPPSQDLLRKKKRKISEKKKVGGQPGHTGSSLEVSSSPDKVVLHKAIQCDDCGFNLTKNLVNTVSRHQVIDIQFTKIIIEHQVEHKICPCGHHQANAFADMAPVQYGPGLKATAVELNQVQCVPLKRCAEFFQQKFLLSLSPATLIAFSRQASARLLIWEEEAKRDLLQSLVLHADETGINIDTKTWWVHVLSNATTTLMVPHQRRGTEGMETEILSNFHGILCHDFWSAYSSFDAIHAPCHAHLQRELTRVHEDYGQTWAKDLATLILRANKKRDKQDGHLTYEQITYFETQYSKLLSHAKKYNPQNKKRNGERGKIGQSYPRRLLNRLIKHRDWILIFLYDPSVPFTNNQAERDIRMLKVQQKVSGYFKTEEGARDYCRIRSYILTMQKRGVSKHKALTQLFTGT